MKSYLVKYLTKKYGKKYRVSYCDWLGLCFTNYLTPIYQKPAPIWKSAYFEIVVPENICRRKGHFVERNDLKRLESTIDNFFKSSMYDFVRINLNIDRNSSKKIIKKTLASFLDSYGINEDDFSLDTACRIYHRMVKKKLESDKKNKSKKKGATSLVNIDVVE
ncbi:hypothetical protein SAMN04489761_3047 [Tenacibaculum sp. MAR_2009_124]|nr:hypothetical protein SAMN04489761_3047 [Tenacibaculum sp. MAR_2009_124]